MSFDLLSEPVRRYIRDKRWETLRPIQLAAISKILSSDNNYIIASRTASGKTEAAFLPILSKVDFNEAGVQVLYISPLIALINDQFYRVEDLCKYMDVSVTKWHGEANKTLKEKLVKAPNGVLLITPESIEAMFINRPYYIKALFPKLKFIIIDEIHSFLGNNRGIQLKSLLSRIKQVVPERIRIIGLSATIGDYADAKKFTGEVDRTKVLVDDTKKELEACFKYIECGRDGFSPAFIKDLYDNTKKSKVLIFPNSRGKAEEIAVSLKKEAVYNKGHQYYYSHHSSVDKELREHIEQFAKKNEHGSFCIACTSTLELGIDIGSVDMVVQVDATYSVASLIQRVGRSGRREGAKSNLFLYATDPWSLLQSIACWQLYKANFIEPFYFQEKPFDILFHQILSILKETSGCSKESLVAGIISNAAFTEITAAEIEYLLSFMISSEIVEDLKRELTVGYKGEFITNSKDFYSVFETVETFKVIHSGMSIGEIPLSVMTVEGQNILLSAKIWKIKDIDPHAKKIFVVPAQDGKKPLFMGNGGDVHNALRSKMAEIIFNEFVFGSTYEESVQDIINEMKLFFQPFQINDMRLERPVILKDKSIQFYTFSGTRINTTLCFLLNQLKLKSILFDNESMIEIIDFVGDFNSLINQLRQEVIRLEYYVDKVINETPDLFSYSKWGKHLPTDLKKQYILSSHFDIPDTLNFLNNLKAVFAN